MNGLIVQWIRVIATSSNFDIVFSSYALPISFTSRTSYVVTTAEGEKGCETRTTKDDDSGYDYGIGIDQKYADHIVVTIAKDRMAFLIMVGY